MASNLRIYSIRKFSLSCSFWGKRNFRKFNLYEKRGTESFWRVHGKKLDPLLKQQYNRGTRPISLSSEEGEEIIPEMIPEIIVPNLEGFNLKPYVSYRVPDIKQEEFTPQDLFYSIYSHKIKSDFENGLLDEDGVSKQPSEEENLTEKEARELSMRTGSDIYG